MCRLSMTTYSIFSQLASVSVDLLHRQLEVAPRLGNSDPLNMTAKTGSVHTFIEVQLTLSLVQVSA
jgi:hypothetical protein